MGKLFFFNIPSFHFLRNFCIKTYSIFFTLVNLPVKATTVALGSAVVVGLILYYRRRQKCQKKPKPLPTM